VSGGSNAEILGISAVDGRTVSHHGCPQHSAGALAGDDAIEDVERRLDRPVVNSNQAVLWAALRRLEISEPIGGLGRLFRTETSGRPQLPDR